MSPSDHTAGEYRSAQGEDTPGRARAAGAMRVLGLLFAGYCAWAAAAQPGEPALVDPMRGPVPILDEPRPPALQNQENKDVRRVRSHPMQPPTIPHKIEGYQLDRDVNRCLFCHARGRIEETRAIPLSVTHYMDRDGNVRGDVSPRRYFCTQCHVPQDEVKPLVGNTFEDFETASRRAAPAAPKR